MYRGKLAESSNLLDLYMYATGHSEIPPPWHQWSCMALVAAAVGDRVYYKKFSWEKMTPNMYIFLVGPSGCGKGGAIGFAQQFLHDRMNSYTGSSTYKSMIDLMARPAEIGGVDRSKMLLIQPELADCVGTGLLANSMIKAMTNWYNPSSQDYQESTRKHGDRIFSPPCLTWLAGTTVEWLRQTVDKEAMLSGFFGRVAISPGIPNLERVYQPTSPPDYADVIEYIKDRVGWLTTLEGEFRMSGAAYECDKYWYETRAEPEPEMRPFWKRQHDLNIKIAMLLSLCESMSLSIKEEHILQAQDMTDQSAKMLPDIIEQATATQATQRVDQVRQLIKKYRRIKHSILLRKVYRWHINGEDLKRIIDQLIEDGSITSRTISGGGQRYEWTGNPTVTMPK